MGILFTALEPWGLGVWCGARILYSSPGRRVAAAELSLWILKMAHMGVGAAFSLLPPLLPVSMCFLFNFSSCRISIQPGQFWIMVIQHFCCNIDIVVGGGEYQHLPMPWGHFIINVLLKSEIQISFQNLLFIYLFIFASLQLHHLITKPLGASIIFSFE